MARVTSKASLTESTEYTVSLAGKTITVNIAGNISSGSANGVTGLALYSSIVDWWKSDANANKYRFPLFIVDGPIGSMLELRDGWEFAAASSIALIRSMGFAYKDTGGTITAEYTCFIQGGTLADNADQPYYMIGSDTTPTDFGVADEFNECIQVYGDATHGDFDKRSAAKLFSREAGKTYGGYDLVTEQQLSALTYRTYLVPMSTVTDSGVSVTGPSGAPYDSMTLTLGATTNTINGTSYNFAEGEIDANSGTVQQVYDWFQNLLLSTGDIDSGAGTQRGDIYLDGSLSFSGGIITTSQGLTIKNISAADASNIIHVDDTGTGRQQATSASISGSGMVDAVGAYNRLQIINTTALSAASWAATTAYSAGDIRLRTTGVGSENIAGLYMRCTSGGTSGAVEPTWNTTVGGTTTDSGVTWTTYAVLYEDSDPLSTSYSATYTDGEEFKAGESYEIRFAEMDGATSFKTYGTTGIVGSDGFTFAASVQADGVFAGYALDGSAYDSTFSPNYATDRIVLDTNTDFTGKSAFSYYCYILTTSQGMYEFWDGVTGVDAGNIRINTATLNLYFDETAGFVKQTDSVRIFRDDDVRPAVDPTTGGSGLEINWRVPVNVVTVATGDAVNQATVEAALTAQGYTTARAPNLDNADVALSEIQAQLNNVSSGSGGIATTASAFAKANAEPETNSYTDTTTVGTLHIVSAGTGGATQVYYEFDVGADGVPQSVEWIGYAQANNDTYSVGFWNWGTSAVDAVDSIDGANGTNTISRSFLPAITHVGSGTNAGLVRLYFTSTDGTNIGTDRILCVYTQVRTGIANGSTITLDGSLINQTYIGYNWNLDLNGQAVTGSHFEGATVSGVCTGASDVSWRNCKFVNVTIPPGKNESCGLKGTFTIGSNGTYTFDHPISEVAGSGSPVLNMNSVVGATFVNIRGHKGGLTVNGLTSDHTLTIGGEELGTITLNGADASIEIRGIYKALANNLTGTPTVNLDGAVKGADVEEIHTRLDLDAAKPNTYADDGSTITNDDFTLTKTDNGNGTGTVNKT